VWHVSRSMACIHGHKHMCSFLFGRVRLGSVLIHLCTVLGRELWWRDGMLRFILSCPIVKRPKTWRLPIATYFYEFIRLTVNTYTYTFVDIFNSFSILIELGKIKILMFFKIKKIIRKKPLKFAPSNFALTYRSLKIDVSR
jgi:hypothetical protein